MAGVGHPRTFACIYSLTSNLKAGSNGSGCAFGPVRAFAVRIEQVAGAVSPLLVLRTAKRLFETLRRNLDDAQAELCSREFDHRLAHDGFQAGAKPTGGAFQQRNDGTGVLALPTEQGAQGSQQFGQIILASDLERNWSDGCDNELGAGALGLRNNDCELCGVHSKNHAAKAQDKSASSSAVEEATSTKQKHKNNND